MSVIELEKRSETQRKKEGEYRRERRRVKNESYKRNGKKRGKEVVQGRRKTAAGSERDANHPAERTYQWKPVLLRWQG